MTEVSRHEPDTKHFLDNHVTVNGIDYDILKSEISELMSSLSVSETVDPVNHSEISEDVSHQSLKVIKKNLARYPTQETSEKLCPNCLSSDVQLSHGSYICYKCCSLLESSFDETGEWKSYQDSNSANPRCSLQIDPYLPETSSHTFMKISGTSAKSGDTDSRYFQKFNQINNWMVPHYEKSLNGRLHDIVYYGNLCNLPGNVIDFVKQIYVEFTDLQKIYKKKKSSRGDCHNAIIAVFYLVSCKEFGIRRSPDDICESIGISSTDFTKAGNLVFSVLQHSYLLDISNHQYIVNSGDYINSFCRIMGISDFELIQTISDLEAKVNKLKILQKNTPQAIACGCIYFVCKMMDIKINRQDFDTKCNVSIPTLNKVFEHLTKYTDQLI